MNKIKTALTAFLLALFPILKIAIANAVVEEIDRHMGPRSRPRPGTRYTSYNRMPPRNQREATRSVGRAVREADELSEEPNPFVPGSTNWNRHEEGLPPLGLGAEWEDGYRGVVTISFDVAAPNAERAVDALKNMMPVAGKNSGDVLIDSWWVAGTTSGNGVMD